MVYRIHFTVEDLARTRVAAAPLPLLELDLAARVLQDRSQPVRLDAWRRTARARLSAKARMALSLIPPVGWSFVLAPRAGKPEELLEDVRSMPRERIGAEVEFGAQRQPVPAWAFHLADDDALYQRFVDGIGDLYSVLLGPHEAQLTELFVADRAMRMRQLADGGVGCLLGQLNPRWMRWNPPVLEVRMANGIDWDLYLEGEGILLTPSLFGTRTLVEDTWPQPIVNYPACHEQPLRRLTTFSTSAVSALLGRTRAAVLYAIAEHPGSSTKELAGLVGIAPPSASEHATVLRKAGLVNTVRHRNVAVHSPTDLGTALLDGRTE